MAKYTGSTRLFKPTKASISQSRKDYTRQLLQATTDVSYSYFSENTGGFMIFMKGHNPQQEEIEVARYLADFGVQVYLTPEGGGYEMYATHSYVKDGKTYYKYSDGKINISTFEQRTPAKIETTIEQSVHQAIMHANSKHAEVAVIYDKNQLYDRNDIEKGMKYYQKKYKKWETKGVKAVIVVSHYGGVFEHHFDAE